jgi:cysteine desulfurase
MSELPVYLDNAATTPIDPRVAESMIDCLRSVHGNPASAGHDFGRRARTLVEKARVQVAETVGARPESIVWTSGATEAGSWRNRATRTGRRGVAS